MLLRRVVPTPAVPSTPTKSDLQPVRPRRPVTRVNAVDISALRRISGFVGGWLVDGETGFVIAWEGRAADPALEAAMQVTISLGRANLRVLDTCPQVERVDDILVTLGQRVHLIRPLRGSSNVFLGVVMDTETCNPGLSRVQLRRVAQSVRL